MSLKIENPKYGKPRETFQGKLIKIPFAPPMMKRLINSDFIDRYRSIHRDPADTKVGDVIYYDRRTGLSVDPAEGEARYKKKFKMHMPVLTANANYILGDIHCSERSFIVDVYINEGHTKVDPLKYKECIKSNIHVIFNGISLVCVKTSNFLIAEPDRVINHIYESCRPHLAKIGFPPSLL